MAVYCCLTLIIYSANSLCQSQWLSVVWRVSSYGYNSAGFRSWMHYWLMKAGNCVLDQPLPSIILTLYIPLFSKQFHKLYLNRLVFKACVSPTDPHSLVSASINLFLWLLIPTEVTLQILTERSDHLVRAPPPAPEVLRLTRMLFIELRSKQWQ